MPLERVRSQEQEQEQQQQQKLPCPRCKSSDTKFCYYNNYNLAQPRHFCKSCRRYWTQGGTLRNIPVGGVSRKNHSTKRSRSFSQTTQSSSTSSSISAAFPVSYSDSDISAVTLAPTSIDFPGSFSSLLATSSSSSPELLAIGEYSFLNRGESEIELGLEEMGVGLGQRGVWPVTDVAGNTWHMGNVEGVVEGDFTWPDLSISTPGNAFQ